MDRPLGELVIARLMGKPLPPVEGWATLEANPQQTESGQKADMIVKVTDADQNDQMQKARRGESSHLQFLQKGNRRNLKGGLDAIRPEFPPSQEKTVT